MLEDVGLGHLGAFTSRELDVLVKLQIFVGYFSDMLCLQVDVDQ